ncbi:aconitase family protein, partial [Elusimicrobiota bacterium]
NAVPGAIFDISIDVRAARDFGGASVVKNIEEHGLGIDDPSKTFFTFDCNPCGSDPGYAANQQKCRLFARKRGIRIYDINTGIGTHTMIDEGILVPGATFISTDSHANIVGAIGAFGQGMGDKDIAYAFAYGKIWFKVPPTVKVILSGTPSASAGPKDIALVMLRKLGASGLLGYAAEIYGTYTQRLSLDARITISSMATEMGGIISLFPPDGKVLEYCSSVSKMKVEPQFADKDAEYVCTVDIDIDGLEPLVSMPGHPEDVADITDVAGSKIDSVFIGSCTNGRFEDMKTAADILKGKKIAPGIVLKIVPSTDRVWKECLDKGIIEIFKRSGALVGNAGCAGCAAGQIGQNGPGEVTVSTGNRNFPGKQGKGRVYLASSAVAAASALAGIITHPDNIPSKPVVFSQEEPKRKTEPVRQFQGTVSGRIKGKIWIIAEDNIDTDMIYHNRYLAITDIEKMGLYTFGNLKGWEGFSKKAAAGDIVITGKNFGCGSSRQQAVDCFKNLKISLIIAASFGAIYERNAVNSGFPVMCADLVSSGLKSGGIIEVDLGTGKIKDVESGTEYYGQAFSEIQMDIYKKGGLL